MPSLTAEVADEDTLASKPEKLRHANNARLVCQSASDDPKYKWNPCLDRIRKFCQDHCSAANNATERGERMKFLHVQAFWTMNICADAPTRAPSKLTKDLKDHLHISRGDGGQV